MTGDLDVAAVREELERILSSHSFTSAPRHSRVLRYLVTRTLAGEGDQLKEYVLGTEVFDRNGAYDPRIDSIVRVEIRRLRARLDEYYSGPGAGDPVIISIPRGTYVPVFAAAPTPGPIVIQPPSVAAGVIGPAVPPPAASRRTRSIAGLTLIATAAAISIGLLVATLVVNSDRSPAAASTVPAVAVLPFQTYSAEPDGVVLAARITDAVTAELAQLGTVSVASRTSSLQYTGERHPVTAIARALNVDFVMESTALWTEGNVRVSARMVDAVTDRKIWVGEYDVSVSDLQRSARRIAEEAAAGVLVYRSVTR